MRSMEWKQLTGKVFMEVLVFGTNHQFSTHKRLRIFRFCVVSWKDEREPSIKYSMGRKIGVVQKFTGIQNFGQNWWWTNGVRVIYFPRIQYVAAQLRSPRVTVEIEWNTREFYRKDHLHVDVQRHLMRIKRQWTGMRIERQPRFYLCKKIFTRKMVILRSWIRKEVVFYSW